MIRRHFFKHLAAAAAGLSVMKANAGQDDTALLQVSAIAGFQFYEGDRIGKDIAAGDRLELRREPGNPYDPRAVEILWHDHKLGYVPMRDNAAVAQLMDLGVVLQARLVKQRHHNDPWQRMRIAILVPGGKLPTITQVDDAPFDAGDYRPRSYPEG